jgi:hypothetical protein
MLSAMSCFRQIKAIRPSSSEGLDCYRRHRLPVEDIEKLPSNDEHQPQLTVTCQACGQSSGIAPIAADLRFGAVRVKGRRSRRDAVGALDVCRAGPSLP